MLLKTLSLIGKELNANKITWAVGASLMLNHYGLVDSPGDIDILVTTTDIDKALEILKGMGHLHDYEKNASYATTYFYELTINGVDIDLMSDMKIVHSQGTYTYDFNQDAIVNQMIINQVSIPLTSLEDWYVLYQLIGRQAKVQMIEDYLKSNGVEHPHRLKAVLSDALPTSIIEKTRSLC